MNATQTQTLVTAEDNYLALSAQLDEAMRSYAIGLEILAAHDAGAVSLNPDRSEDRRFMVIQLERLAAEVSDLNSLVQCAGRAAVAEAQRDLEAQVGNW